MADENAHQDEEARQEEEGQSRGGGHSAAVKAAAAAAATGVAAVAAKKAFSGRPLATSQMLKPSDAPPIVASAIGNADRLPPESRTAAQSIGGKAR